MAVLNKIRQRSIFLIIIIALALFSFIIGDIFSNMGASDKSQNVVATINGNDIERGAFMNQVESIQRQSGGSVTNTQAMNRVWDIEVRNKVMQSQYDAVGIAVERDFMRQLLKQNLGSLEEFKKHIKAEDFVEWEEVYRDNFYGTLKSEVERIWAKEKNVIFDIDVAGGLRIKSKFKQETLAVFVKPPSVDELKIRLKKRKTESEEKINMRIAKASVELATAPQFDFIIENIDLDIALKEAEILVKNYINNSYE